MEDEKRLCGLLFLRSLRSSTIRLLPPYHFADLARVKDEKHLQRPQRNQWAVMLEPLPPEKPTKKKDKPAAAASTDGAVPEQQGQATSEAEGVDGKAAAPQQQAAAATE